MDDMAPPVPPPDTTRAPQAETTRRPSHRRNHNDLRGGEVPPPLAPWDAPGPLKTSPTCDYTSFFGSGKPNRTQVDFKLFFSLVKWFSTGVEPKPKDHEGCDALGPANVVPISQTQQAPSGRASKPFG